MIKTPLYFLSSILAVASFLSVWQFGLKPYFLDRMRDRLFELRYQLFALGLSGALEYDGTVYRMFEALMNALLRHAHDISLLRLTIQKRNRTSKQSFEPDYASLLAQQIESTAPDSRKELTRIHNEMQRALVLYVLSISPFALLIGLYLFVQRAFFAPVVSTRIAFAEALEREAMSEDFRMRAKRHVHATIAA